MPVVSPAAASGEADGDDPETAAPPATAAPESAGQLPPEPAGLPPRPAPTAAPARVAQTTQQEPKTSAQPRKATPESKHRLNWTYPRFRWWEYVAAGAVTAGNIGLEIAYQAQPKERWHGPILFDSAVRDAFKGDEDMAELATTIGDWTWYGVQNYVLLDGILTPLVSDRLNGDVAFQLTLLNWQAVGLTGLISRAAHITVGRTRPSLEGCEDDDDDENECEFRGASFFSGHAAMTTASAALGCLNHAYLPMYGGGIADALVCPVLLTGAVTVGLARIVNDKHWVSDVIIGWGVGGAIGFGLPYFLHYGPSAVKVALQPLPNTALLPWADPTSAGVRFVGAL